MHYTNTQLQMKGRLKYLCANHYPFSGEHSLCKDNDSRWRFRASWEAGTAEGDCGTAAGDCGTAAGDCGTAAGDCGTAAGDCGIAAGVSIRPAVGGFGDV